MNKIRKYSIYYLKNGMTYRVEVDKLFDQIPEVEYELRPTYRYFLETEEGMKECDKDKNII